MKLFQLLRHILLAVAGSGSIAMGIIMLTISAGWYENPDAHVARIERFGFAAILLVAGLVLLAMACPVKAKSKA